MAISDRIITPAQISAVHVEAQPTVLHGTATQNKQVFDKYCDMIAEHFNGLVGDLETSMSPTIDDSVKQLYASLGWVDDSSI